MPIPMGPSVSDGYYLEPADRWYADTTPSSIGSAQDTYSSTDVGTAKVEKNTPKKTGAYVQVYDPEIANLFAGNV